MASDGRFRLPSTRAVGDLIAGTTVTALRSILLSIEVASEVAELILRGLGVALDEAHEIARRPIPPLRRRRGKRRSRKKGGTPGVIVSNPS